MTHSQHVNLIQKAIPQQGGRWADFGSGDGAFTLALRDLAGPDVEIYSIDQDNTRLAAQEMEFTKHFPDTKITFLHEDFTKPLHLLPLEGIIMANSLHYVKQQTNFLPNLQTYLKPGGKLVLVEYNIDTPNPWVPYPLSFKTFEHLTKTSNFIQIKLLKKIPSSYWEEMYCAEAIKSLS